MPIYHQLGEVPGKRHSIFRRPDGGLHTEELVGNHGFTGPSSLLYHLHPPTQVLSTRPAYHLDWKHESPRPLRHRHFYTHRTAAADRIPILYNHDVAILTWTPHKSGFYRNAQADEVLFVTEGAGVLESQMGELPYRAGDYLVIPRGITHRLRMNPVRHRFLIIESAGHVRFPKRYRNEFGQLLEHAPYSERDIRRPQSLPVHDESGEFPVVVKKDNWLHEVMVDHHPFDVVGWDGFYYPFAFNINDFEPRVGRFHLPPPVHQTFEGDGFVICSFCPRPFDFDPQAIPAPYNHSNVMSDEVLYYANSEFMSRKGIEYGSITLHPDGLPHGPHPGRTEESINKSFTQELAVMVDTFRPLEVAESALAMEDREYFRSWLP